MAIQTVDLGPVKGPKGDKGDTGVVDTNTPLAYTESTAETAPATGSKLGAIVGWLVGKLKAIIAQNNDFAKSISSLNSKIETKSSSVSVANSSSGITVKRQGAHVLVNADVNFLYTVNSGTVLITLPEGYRPSGQAVAFAEDYSGNRYRVTISATGIITNVSSIPVGWTHIEFQYFSA